MIFFAFIIVLETGKLRRTHWTQPTVPKISLTMLKQLSAGCWRKDEVEEGRWDYFPKDLVPKRLENRKTISHTGNLLELPVVLHLKG